MLFELDLTFVLWRVKIISSRLYFNEFPVAMRVIGEEQLIWSNQLIRAINMIEKIYKNEKI